MASKTSSLSVEGVGSKSGDDHDAGSKVSSPSSKEADSSDRITSSRVSAGTKSSEASDAAQEGKSSPARDAAGSGSTSSGGRSSSQATPIIVEAGGRREGPNLVQRFVDFVFRVIHTEMDSFFTEQATKFDQDWEDFNQQGETLEQYQVCASTLVQYSFIPVPFWLRRQHRL